MGMRQVYVKQENAIVNAIIFGPRAITIPRGMLMSISTTFKCIKTLRSKLSDRKSLPYLHS